jgi:hypothetical protein
VNEHQRTWGLSCAVLVGTRPGGYKQTEGAALSGTAAPASEGEVAAVLAALAGVRRGDAVAAVGAGRLTRACLAAGCGEPLLDEVSAADATARVVVVERAYDVAGALRLLAPGGRLVGVAADRGAAARAAGQAGLELRHVEPLGAGVAWSGVRPLAP